MTRRTLFQSLLGAIGVSKVKAAPAVKWYPNTEPWPPVLDSFWWLSTKVDLPRTEKMIDVSKEFKKLIESGKR